MAAGCSESTERNGITRYIESAAVRPDGLYSTQPLQIIGCRVLL